MTDFSHKEWSYRALVVAGWKDLRSNPQRNWWWGTDPEGTRFQPAPMLTRDHTSALMAAHLERKRRVTIQLLDDKVAVTFRDWQNVVTSYAEVCFTDCNGNPMAALARALTVALAKLDGREEQLSLFGGE
jgi:hypothetical protein